MMGMKGVKGLDLYDAIARLTAAVGVTGDEAGVAQTVQELFSQYAQDVWQDHAGNVYARIGQGAPTVLLMAHMDEVGMIVHGIEDNGMLRVRSVAGVDPRVLPGSVVMVHGSETLSAVVGATPPHLLSGEQAAYRIEEVSVDTGLSPSMVRQLISVGDFVTYAPEPPLELQNGWIAGKTMDDRAMLACLLWVMEQLKLTPPPCTVVFAASVEEEKSSLGAVAGGYGIIPDMAVALDATFAKQPGIKPPDDNPMDRVVLGRGANIHPWLLQRLEAAAKALELPLAYDVVMGCSYTDAWELQVQRLGVPTAIVSVPVRYMHTPVETLDLNTLERCAKLITRFLMDLNQDDWEDSLCFDS